MENRLSSDRRCSECGNVQQLVRKTVPYEESGLNNVQLENVPVWVCSNGHEEVTIPAMTQLHELIAHSIIRKPAPLDKEEIRFLRRRVDQTAREFAAHLGISAVHLSRMENGPRVPPRSLDLLIRLVTASLIAARDKKPFPADLAPFVDQLEQTWNIGTHRLKHVDQTLPEEDQWVEAAS
ncbi:MAG: helix-turn-helix domain-containing protein [Acidobacteriota bacterium]